MSFGGVLSVAVLVLAAIVFYPRGIQVDKYEQVALLLVSPLGRLGFYLFAAALGIACLGAALEIALSVGYLMAQGLGWNWGEEHEPREAARFSVVYTLSVVAGTLLMLVGIDPLKLTLLTMALTAVVLPLVIVPFIVLMNDSAYVGDHKNGRISNVVVVLVIGLAFVIAIVAIPLEIFGG
jgi:Mn2+/Fe2+ NRAMP family transporter